MTGSAGCCVIYNAHLWHGGTQNTSHQLRRAQHAFFTRRVRPSQSDVSAMLDSRVAERLDRSARAIYDL